MFSQRYKNTRLRTDRVNDFLNSAVVKSTGNINTTQWRSLWIGAEEEENFKSAYRSTLIVPITLINSTLSLDFCNFVKEHTNSKENSRHIDRTILGFLCFDHVDPNYFNEDSDVDVGYMFADWLSLFLFVRYMYTTMSKSFGQCTAEFSSVTFVNGLMEELNNFASNDDSRSQSWSGGAPMATRNNDVFPTDELLRIFSREEMLTPHR